MPIFNDNIYKNVPMLMIAFQRLTIGHSDILINLAAGLFILSFFLFSAVASQVVDKYDILLGTIGEGVLVVFIFYFDSPHEYGCGFIYD